MEIYELRNRWRTKDKNGSIRKWDTKIQAEEYVKSLEPPVVEEPKKPSWSKQKGRNK